VSDRRETSVPQEPSLPKPNLAAGQHHKQKKNKQYHPCPVTFSLPTKGGREKKRPGGVWGAGPEGPPNVNEGAGQAPPLTGWYTLFINF